MNSKTPRTYAVLGGTGKAGRGVVRNLLEKTDGDVRIYVRSMEKLLSLFPTVASNPRISVFHGDVTDTGVMIGCLRGRDVIFFTLGENDNRKGVSVIEDGARTVLAALKILSDADGWTPPRLILLSSSTWNEKFSAARPKIIDNMIKTAFNHPYADLRRGQTLLVESELCNTLLVQPGGLVQDIATGYEISTETGGLAFLPCDTRLGLLTEGVHLACTYEDLAAAFVELANNAAYEKVEAVGVSSMNGDNYARHAPTLFATILRGLFAQYIPGFWTVHDAIFRWTG
jgi:oxidoreductase AflX